MTGAVLVAGQLGYAARLCSLLCVAPMRVLFIYNGMTARQKAGASILSYRPWERGQVVTAPCAPSAGATRTHAWRAR